MKPPKSIMMASGVDLERHSHAAKIAWSRRTMSFESTAKVLAECKLKYCKLRVRHPPPAFVSMALHQFARIAPSLLVVLPQGHTMSVYRRAAVWAQAEFWHWMSKLPEGLQHDNTPTAWHSVDFGSISVSDLRRICAVRLIESRAPFDLPGASAERVAMALYKSKNAAGAGGGAGCENPGRAGTVQGCPYDTRVRAWYWQVGSLEHGTQPPRVVAGCNPCIILCQMTGLIDTVLGELMVKLRLWCA